MKRNKSMKLVYLILFSLLLVFPLAAMNKEVNQLPKEHTPDISIPPNSSASSTPKNDANNEELNEDVQQIQITTQMVINLFFSLITLMQQKAFIISFRCLFQLKIMELMKKYLIYLTN